MSDMDEIKDIMKVLPDSLKKWANSWPEDIRKYTVVVAFMAMARGVKNEEELQGFFDSDPRMQIVLMNLLYHAGDRSREFIEKLMDRLEPEAVVLIKSDTQQLISMELNKRMNEIKSAFQNLPRKKRS